MRIVLDTNVLLISIGSKSPFRTIFNAVLSGRCSLVVTTEILLEYEEKLLEKTNVVVAINIMQAILALPELVRIDQYRRHNRIFTDPDDNKFVDCYLAANADYLVSNDRHFGDLRAAGFPAVRVVSAEGFLEVI